MGILDDITEDKEYADHMQAGLPKLKMDSVGLKSLLTFYKIAIVPAALMGFIPVIGYFPSFFALSTAKFSTKYVSGVDSPHKFWIGAFLYKFYGIISLFVAFLVYVVFSAFLMHFFGRGVFYFVLLEVIPALNLLYVVRKQRKVKTEAEGLAYTLNTIKNM